MNLPGFFYYLTLIQYTKYTKHAVFDPLNHLFKLIKLFPELLKFVTVRADKRQSLYLYTDLNGMPEELTDEAGEIVWECSY